jgi:hypothetical protein
MRIKVSFPWAEVCEGARAKLIALWDIVVDGCKDGSDEPGALEFDWLEVQLDSFRDRGMQVSPVLPKGKKGRGGFDQD